MSILYEVTGYQTESDNFQFWNNYCNFEDLGDENLITRDKIEEKEQRQFDTTIGGKSALVV